MKSKKTWIFLISLQMMLLLGLGWITLESIFIFGSSLLPETNRKFPYEIFALSIFWIGVSLYLSIRHLRSLSKKPAKPYIHKATRKQAAPLGNRVTAALIDALILLPLIIAPNFIKTWDLKLYTLSFLLIQSLFLYQLLFDWLTGQTIGKKILKIKLYSFNGKKVSFLSSFIRGLPYNVQSLINILLFILIIPQLGILDFSSLNYDQLFIKTENLVPFYELGYLLSIYFFTFDLLFAVFRKDRRALHDLISQTIVVKEKR